MRIAILGNSGSGKSTLARKLAGGLAATLDLDTLVWEPGKVAVPRDPARALAELERFCAGRSAWVVEGCYASLIEASLRFEPELVFLDPGVDACLANCRARPWEPHKYSSKAEQDAKLGVLLPWVADYYAREGDMSHKAHAALFERYPGPKRRIVKLDAA